MKKIDKHFYQQRVALNVLANSPENAKAVYDAGEGHVLVGVLSKDYDTVPAAIQAMQLYGEQIDDAVSIGLGGGDNRQAAVVAEIAKEYAGSHINQVFPAVAATRANLMKKDSWINALVSPAGQVGYVNISTGPISSTSEKPAIVPVRTAIDLIKDMGGQAVKYFPMNGLSAKEEYKAVAEACADAGFGLEPTGGIDLNNFAEILDIALAAGVPKVIPHVYSSIIDKETGETRVTDVDRLFTMIKESVKKYN